jgi:formate-nitrite transporter family protein
MATAPTPQEIYERAEAEGRRRLDMPVAEQLATGFIAGVTIVFGIVALGIVESLLAPRWGAGVGRLGGALAFGAGVVFLVVGRAELFSENFFDPVTVAIEEGGTRVWGRLVRLWAIALLLNLVGGAVLVAILTVDGALPAPAVAAMERMAEDIVATSWSATAARAVLAGALLTLLSYMLNATNTVGARIPVAFLVGFVLALGPFDHVVVSALHVLFGIWSSGAPGYGGLLRNISIATCGNVLGGVLLMTLTHTAQVRAAR